MMDASIVTQSTRSKKKVHQILLESDHQPQYFSDAMSVLSQPSGGGGKSSYYVVYNHTTSDCKRDDDDDMSAVTLPTLATSSRRDAPPQMRRVSFLCGGDDISSPRSLHRSSPVLSMLDEDDVLLAYSSSSMIDDEDDINVQGFASQAAETCVACTLPVIHFIQFFICFSLGYNWLLHSVSLSLSLLLELLQRMRYIKK